MKACKYLDYEENKYDIRSCKLCTLAPDYPEVKYWERKELGVETAIQNVQFCKLRGRVPGIFQCYNENELACYKAE